MSFMIPLDNYMYIDIEVYKHQYKVICVRIEKTISNMISCKNYHVTEIANKIANRLYTTYIFDYIIIDDIASFNFISYQPVINLDFTPKKQVLESFVSILFKVDMTSSFLNCSILLIGIIDNLYMENGILYIKKQRDFRSIINYNYAFYQTDELDILKFENQKNLVLTKNLITEDSDIRTLEFNNCGNIIFEYGSVRGSNIKKLKFNNNLGYIYISKNSFIGPVLNRIDFDSYDTEVNGLHYLAESVISKEVLFINNIHISRIFSNNNGVNALIYKINKDDLDLNFTIRHVSLMDMIATNFIKFYLKTDFHCFNDLTKRDINEELDFKSIRFIKLDSTKDMFNIVINVYFKNTPMLNIPCIIV